MNTELDFERIVPQFIVNDRNGYAMTRAIQAGLRDCIRVCNAGIATLQDPEEMPEWRLDEMAWELNCLYDYGGTVEMKRAWIRNAMTWSQLYGTPEAIRRYLEGYFDNVIVEEGETPFHFRVLVDGDWTEGSAEWMMKAIETAKNVRSVMDDFGMQGIGRAAAACTAISAKTAHKLCGRDEL